MKRKANRKMIIESLNEYDGSALVCDGQRGGIELEPDSGPLVEVPREVFDEQLARRRDAITPLQDRVNEAYAKRLRSMTTT